MRNIVCQWAVQEQVRRWNTIHSCWQAMQLLQDNSIHFAKCAVRLSRKDLRILVGLLSGRNRTLNQIKSNQIYLQAQKNNTATITTCDELMRKTTTQWALWLKVSWKQLLHEPSPPPQKKRERKRANRRRQKLYSLIMCCRHVKSDPRVKKDTVYNKLKKMKTIFISLKRMHCGWSH